jgi:hypothetical protein
MTLEAHSATHPIIFKSYRLEPNVSEVKAKLDSNAVVAGSFKHKLSEFVQMIVSAEVNIHDWSAGSHRFGLGLSFE